MTGTVDLPEWARLLPLMRARCCRDWPVLAAVRLGTCGLCGSRPLVVGEW